MQKTTLQFETRNDFRNWLMEHCRSSEGVWLIFGKTKECITLKASEALEEALCFGWIDGVMKRIDDHTYVKYFAERRNDSNWSEKNKALVQQLEKQNLMHEYGREKIRQAEANGQWDSTKKVRDISEDDIHQLEAVLMECEQAYTNFQNMSHSVKKTYTRAYYDAKTEAGRAKRIAWMIDRLKQNLKPM